MWPSKWLQQDEPNSMLAQTVRAEHRQNLKKRERKPRNHASRILAMSNRPWESERDTPSTTHLQLCEKWSRKVSRARRGPCASLSSFFLVPNTESTLRLLGLRIRVELWMMLRSLEAATLQTSVALRIKLIIILRHGEKQIERHTEKRWFKTRGGKYIRELWGFECRHHLETSPFQPLHAVPVLLLLLSNSCSWVACKEPSSLCLSREGQTTGLMNWLLKIAAYIQCIGKWVWFRARKNNLQECSSYGSSYGSSIRRVLSQCTSCLHLRNSFSLASEFCSTCTSKTRNNELWISSQESSGWRVWLLFATCICFIFFLLDSFWFKLEEAENASEA